MSPARLLAAVIPAKAHGTNSVRVPAFAGTAGE
jgi:hypothetical protein